MEKKGLKQKMKTLNKPNSSSTTLYSSAQSINCHAVRFIMEHKSIEKEIIIVNAEEMPANILELNPYQDMPTLFDRNMVIYDLMVIIEYLDERFPFPPLMPVDPIKKSEKRLLLYRFTRAKNCWYDLAQTILTGNKKNANQARQSLKNSLIELTPLFAHQPYFKSDKMTLVDACLAPILWRLDLLEIDLSSAKPIMQYKNRIFAENGFNESLTSQEKDFIK